MLIVEKNLIFTVSKNGHWAISLLTIFVDIAQSQGINIKNRPDFDELFFYMTSQASTHNKHFSHNSKVNISEAWRKHRNMRKSNLSCAV